MSCLIRLSAIGRHLMLRHRNRFQPYQTLRLICYRLLSREGDMQRTLPPHLVADVDHAGSGRQTLADFSENLVRIQPAVQAIKGAAQ
jgi:hypothetical protein